MIKKLIEGLAFIFLFFAIALMLAVWVRIGEQILVFLMEVSQ